MDSKPIHDSKKIRIEKCKQILNRKGRKYSDEDAKKIRDFLYAIATLEAEHFRKLFP
jgi:hypothetical protein